MTELILDSLLMLENLAEIFFESKIYALVVSLFWKVSHSPYGEDRDGFVVDRCNPLQLP